MECQNALDQNISTVGASALAGSFGKIIIEKEFQVHSEKTRVHNKNLKEQAGVYGYATSLI